MEKIKAIGQLRTAEQFKQYLAEREIDLHFEEVVESGDLSPLSASLSLSDGLKIGNRFCIQPMEGWDGTLDGKPTDYTLRRWRNFGISGAKLIWGCEAVAVRQDGRANPNQLILTTETQESLAGLFDALMQAHKEKFGMVEDMVVGLQLTHSGRFSKPNDQKRMEPAILYHHPYLDAKFGIKANSTVLSDSQIEDIIQAYVHAAKLAAEIGFHFVDIKHCHGYLGHEFLSSVERTGKYGGSFENRTRFLMEIVDGIQRVAPGLRIGVRLSAIDLPVFQADPQTGKGIPVIVGAYPFRFGGDQLDPLGFDLAEPIKFLQLLQDLGIYLVNLTAGSPYYNPHLQRPALFPPSDGYQPPEDPLVGVARQVNMVSRLKQRFPALSVVGSAYSYLQEWLPNVGQYYVRNQLVDFIGLGRMVLAYPEMPEDVLTGKPLDRKRICRTFSDCTTAPRNGLISGCYPIDPIYKATPQAQMLADIKAKAIRK